jgi:hypothetical protein
MVQRIGRPQAENLSRAGQMVAGMPQPLLDAAREPFVAQAVIYALLLSRDDAATRTRQLQALQGKIEPALYQHTQELAATTQALSADARLPLADLTISALKKSSPQQYAQFRQVVKELVGADHKIDLFEYCLCMVLFSYLDVHFGRKKPSAIRNRKTTAIARPAIVVLSTLAYVGQRRPEEIDRAFQAGAHKLLGQAELAPRQQCTLRTFDAALTELAQASPNIKRDTIMAVTACIAADGKVTLEESELLRAIAAVLGCPVPPVVATANVA